MMFCWNVGLKFISIFLKLFSWNIADIAKIAFIIVQLLSFAAQLIESI